MQKQLCFWKKTVPELQLVWKYPLCKTLLLSRWPYQKVHIRSTNTFLPCLTITYSIINPYFILKYHWNYSSKQTKMHNINNKNRQNIRKMAQKSVSGVGVGEYKFLIGTYGTNMKKKTFNNRMSLHRSCVNVIWSHLLVIIVITPRRFSLWNCSPFSIFD